MNYDPRALPDMTVKQALHIMGQPYDSFPYAVRMQASAVLQIEQAHTSKTYQSLDDALKAYNKNDR